jgi:hypothetical protein
LHYADDSFIESRANLSLLPVFQADESMKDVLRFDNNKAHTTICHRVAWA